MEKPNRWKVYTYNTEHGAEEKGSYRLLKEADAAALEYLPDNEAVMVYDALNLHAKIHYGLFPVELLDEMRMEGEAERRANE